MLAALPFEVEKHLRTEKTVEAALREIGSKPLKDLGPLRTKTGRKRLWALDGSKVKAIYAMGRADVIATYDAAVAAKNSANVQADEDEDRAELDEFADLM